MWALPAWFGRQLPERAARRGSLAAYATWCTAVEGNTTFYAVPSAAAVASWAAQAPAGFRFVAKLPRTVTHEARLRPDRAGPDTRRLLDALAPLGERVATIVAQLPASFGPADLPVLARYGRRLPRDVPNRWAVEVRHPAFFDGSPAGAALEDLLGDLGLEWIPFDTTTLFATPPRTEAERVAWGDKPRLPRRLRALTDRPVVRYLGRDDPAATEAGWAPWPAVVAGWLREGREPTFFVHTPDNVDALVLARRFHAAVAELVPDLDPLPEPPAPDAGAPETLF